MSLKFVGELILCLVVVVRDAERVFSDWGKPTSFQGADGAAEYLGSSWYRRVEESRVKRWIT